MLIAQQTAQLMDALIGEMARPSPERKAPTLPPARNYHVVPVDGVDGWDLELGYTWERESVEDAPVVQVVEATLCTPARRIPLTLADVARVAAAVEDELVDEVEAREQAEAEERHPSRCRCRDCRDERGQWEYQSRKEDRGPR
jgi:hypothetical protein